jgi:uncharacterized repeat protein (TIGR01451 family)
VVVQPNGTVTYTPNAGHSGTDTFTYTISDGNGGTDTATVSVVVGQPPRAAPDAASTPQGTKVTVDLLVNDVPGDRGTPCTPPGSNTPAGCNTGAFDPTSLVFTDPAATNNGRTLLVSGQGTYTIDPATGNVMFDPLPQFTGQATPVAYKVTDSNGNTTGSTLTITVVGGTGGPCVPAPGQNPDCTTTPAQDDSSDLALTKRVVSGAQATVGDRVRYRLQVSNRGSATASAPIRLTDPLPAGLELRSAHGKGWKCAVRKASDTVSCVRRKALGADRKAPPVFVVAVATKVAMGRVVNVAYVSVAGETARSNNRDRASITVIPAQLPSTGFRPMPGLM